MLRFSVAGRFFPPTTEDPLQPATQRVVTDLLRRIDTAEYAPGDPIPTVVQLAQFYEVTISDADEARRHLIADGVLTLRPGVGALVVATPASEPTDEQLDAARRRLDQDIAFLRRAIDDPDSGVRWDPGTHRG